MEKGHPPKSLCMTVLVIYMFLIPEFNSQTLYSASIYWIPTGRTREVCLQAYTTSHITVQVLNRWTGGYMWVCTDGCTGYDVISDLKNLLFAEIAGLSDDNWEAGEEVLIHTFDDHDNINVKLRFNPPNSTISTGLGDAMVTIAARNDTNKINASPSVVVLPIYRVPLGCTLKIDLLPFDNDGDDVICRWSDVIGNLTSATLEESRCKVTIKATSTNGFVSETFHRASLYVEDYSRTDVVLKHRVSVITRGPFSRSPILFTVHILKVPSDPTVCDERATFNNKTTDMTNGAVSRKAPFTENITFSSDALNSSIMTVGPLGMLFKDDVNHTSITSKQSAWNVNDVNLTGVVRTCGMVYSAYDVPGEVRCLTYLINGTDECSNVTCNGKCTNYWMHHVCQAITSDHVATHTSNSSNAGLIIGLAVGLFSTLVAIVIGATIYLRRIWLNSHRIQTGEASKNVPLTNQ